MARSNWTIWTKTGSGNTWEYSTTLFRPNDNFSIGKVSTQTRISLADGSQGFITPATKYLDNDLVFAWYEDDGTIKTQIERYITNQTNLKIIDHNSVQYIGRFSNIESLWPIGFASNIYDIRATFTIIASLA